MTRSFKVGIGFTLPERKRVWLAHTWGQSYPRFGFAGVRVLGLEANVEWWGFTLPHFTRRREDR